MSTLPTDHPLPLLARKMGGQWWRVPDGAGTYGGGHNVWLEGQYADQIEQNGQLVPLPKPGGGRITRKAQSLFYALHESVHAFDQEGQHYQGNASEIQANQVAAQRFRAFCRNLGFSPLATMALWRALPDYYRHPDYVEETSK